VSRGDIRWADLSHPAGADPAFRRPVLVVQSDAFNRSRIDTVVVVALTSSMRLLDAPGNVLLAREVSGLPKDSVANVSQLVTLARAALHERAGRIPRAALNRIDDGLRLVMDLA
jgi:mRNA interferase MazF